MTLPKCLGYQPATRSHPEGLQGYSVVQGGYVNQQLKKRPDSCSHTSQRDWERPPREPSIIT